MSDALARDPRRTLVINLPDLIDDARCFQTVRDLRWPDGISCPHCSSTQVIKDGRDDTQPHRQRYDCRSCSRRFDDLTGTLFAGHHQPLQNWILCLYFMGLNLSSYQIAKELGLRSVARHWILIQTKVWGGWVAVRAGPALATWRGFPSQTGPGKGDSAPLHHS
jgi:transposase-like protein